MRYKIQSARYEALKRSFVSRISYLKSHQGFTLIETLVAIAVLLTAVVGPLSIAAKGLAASLLARDQVTAQYLAQEGIEYIRGIRDKNILLNQDWLAGLSSCQSGSVCNVDSKNNLFIECGATCPVLKYDAASGFYNTASGIDSPFRRSLTIEPISAYEVLVTATISWTSGLFPRSFRVKEVLTDWGSGVSDPATATN